MYHCFKSVIGREEYLDLIKVNICRTALAQFRLGMSPFNAHRLRYSLSEANRVWLFFPDKVEDEAHVLFDCFMYGNIRNVYINKAQNISHQEQVLSVLKCADENSLVALGKYLFLAVQIHKKTTWKWCISIVVRFLYPKRCWLKLCMPHLELPIRSVWKLLKMTDHSSCWYQWSVIFSSFHTDRIGNSKWGMHSHACAMWMQVGNLFMW